MCCLPSPEGLRLCQRTVPFAQAAMGGSSQAAGMEKEQEKLAAALDLCLGLASRGKRQRAFQPGD